MSPNPLKSGFRPALHPIQDLSGVDYDDGAGGEGETEVSEAGVGGEGGECQGRGGGDGEGGGVDGDVGCWEVS